MMRGEMPERMVLMVGAIGGGVFAVVGLLVVLVAGVTDPQLVGFVGTMAIVAVLSTIALATGAGDA